MDVLITGEIEHTIDSSNRLFVSRKLRNQMGGGEMGMVVYLTPCPNGVLGLYGEESFRRYAYASPASENRNQAEFERFIFSKTHQYDLDKGGRIQFTEKIKREYNLSNDLTLIGVGDHIEIWNTGDWVSYCDEKLAKFQPEYNAARSRAFDANRKDINSVPLSSIRDEG